jgi:hypothetical protein
MNTGIPAALPTWWSEWDKDLIAFFEIKPFIFLTALFFVNKVVEKYGSHGIN